VQDVSDISGLPAGVPDGVAGVGDLQPGEFIEVIIDGQGEPAQQASAVSRGERPPGRQGGPSQGDRLIDICSRRGRDGAQLLFGCRVYDLSCVCAHRIA